MNPEQIKNMKEELRETMKKAICDFHHDYEDDKGESEFYTERILDLFKKYARGCVPKKIDKGIIVAGLRNGRECDIWIRAYNHCREKMLRGLK